MMNAKETLSEWLANGDLERVVAGLWIVRKKLGDKDLAQNVDFQSSRYKGLQNNYLKGLVSHADYSLELAKIRQSLQEIIAGLPDGWNVEELETAPPSVSDRVTGSHPVTAPRDSIFWKKLGYLAIIAGILGGFAEFFNFINLFPSRSDDSIQLTVYVQDAESKPVPELQNTGYVKVIFGDDLRYFIIGENGRSNIGEIPIKFRGQEIEVVLVAEGWEPMSPGKKYVMDGKPVYLIVKRDDKLGWVQGIVKNRDGSQFIAGAMVMVDNDTTVATDSLGRFRLQRYYRILRTTADRELERKKKEVESLLEQKEKDYQKISDLFALIVQMQAALDSAKIKSIGIQPENLGYRRENAIH